MHYIQQKILELAKTQDLGKLSLRKMGSLIGEKSYPQKIKHHLDQLKKKGLVHIDKRKRLIKTVNPGWSKISKFYSVPILGSANCGEAVMFAEERAEGYLKVSKKMLSTKKKGLFALKAVGHSMNRACVGPQRYSIENGDFILIDKEDTDPRNGDYVLSIIDNCANVKKFIRDNDNNQIVLASESTLSFPPIYIHQDDQQEYMINGKVVQIIKKPKGMQG